MGSSAESDHSLSSGISIPQWMKSRIGDRYDIDEPFSPPTHDDTFFYVRYPKSTVKPAKDPGIKLIEEESLRAPLQDYSQHTLPCRQLVPGAKMSQDVKEITPVKPQPPRSKPQGTDDGFSGDGAACGKSVVQVAQQMIAGKSLLRGFSLANNNDTLTVPTDGFDPSHRRGSRSLPSSPLGTPSPSPETSPRLRRKATLQNRYFTGTFSMDKPVESSSKYPGSWILTSLLRQSGAAGLSTPSRSIIHEEEPVEKAVEKKEIVNLLDVPQMEEKADMRRNKSTPSLVSSDMLDENSEISSVRMPSINGKKLYQAKPSELREMNFWSPTSM